MAWCLVKHRGNFTFTFTFTLCLSSGGTRKSNRGYFEIFLIQIFPVLFEPSFVTEYESRVCCIFNSLVGPNDYTILTYLVEN
jgi:hypothetical protein